MHVERITELYDPEFSAGHGTITAMIKEMRSEGC